MIKFITNCREFGTGNISINDLISDDVSERKNDIINYLKNGKDDGVRCSSVYDYIGDFSTGNTVHCYTDGVYQWDDTEIYHFEKYNLKLEKAFVDSVIVK